MTINLDELRKIAEAEEWRPILGFEGFYEVSDQGRVRSLDRILSDGRRWRGQVMRTQIVDRYEQLVLSRNGQSARNVHVLALEAFRGERPIGMEVCHGNGISTDNRLENLRWDTPKSNAADRETHGRTARSERNGSAKLTSDEVRDIRECISKGETQRLLADRYGVSQSTVWRAVHTHWKAVA